MINIVIYGNSKKSVEIRNFIEECSACQDEIFVRGFVVNNPSGNGEFSFDALYTLYTQKEIEAIVIPTDYYIQYNNIIQHIIRLGININDVYNGHNEKISKNSEFGDVVIPMLSDSYLPYLEYHVADHCNLNCKYCTHYSPLVKAAVFPNYDVVQNDLRQLKKYIENIGVIRILGGEPLLNSDLPKFIEMTRAIYPRSIIYVVTNGLLIKNASESLFESMRKNTAFFHISLYPPLLKIKDEIQKFLIEKDVPYMMSSLNSRFNKTQKIEPSDEMDYFYSCFQATCTCIYEGKISPCFTPFMTKYFNDSFDMTLPETGGIDLYDEENTTESIKLQLLYPLERCKYCYSGEAKEWEIVGKSSSLEDWI